MNPWEMNWQTGRSPNPWEMNWASSDMGGATASDPLRPPRADAPASPVVEPYQQTVSSVAGQAGAGSQQGIANMLGFPVDAITAAINGLGGNIQNPIGGSQNIADALAPFRQGISAPQTPLERGARRVGEEVGAAAVTAPALALRAGSQVIPALAAEGLSALGSGTGAAVANEFAPDSLAAEVVGSLGGGLLAGGAAARALGLNGTSATVRSGIDEQRSLADDAYNGRVRAYTDTVTQPNVETLAQNVSARAIAEGADPTLHPKAFAAMQRLNGEADTPRTIEEMERLRRFVQRNVSSSMDPEEKRLGQIMVEEITGYIDNLSPSQMTGRSDPSDATGALVEGRMATRRAKAAETVSDATTRAQRRAARTGSGGNEINAIRQNISALIDNPRKSRGFTPAEKKAMEEIVMGTPVGNAARSLSRFAPSSGGLAAMLNVGGTLAAPQVALPIMAMTEGAKLVGDRAIRGSADRLVNLMAPDRILAPGEQGLRGLLAALMAGRTAANAGE